MNANLQVLSMHISDTGRDLSEETKESVLEWSDKVTDYLMLVPKTVVKAMVLVSLGFVGLMIFTLLFSSYALLCIAMTTLRSIQSQMLPEGVSPFKELTDSILALVNEKEEKERQLISLYRDQPWNVLPIEAQPLQAELTPRFTSVAAFAVESEAPAFVAEAAQEPAPETLAQPPADVPVEPASDLTEVVAAEEVAQDVTTPVKLPKKGKKPVAKKPASGYTEYSMKQAIDAVLGGMSMRAASKKYGVPFSTLSGRIKVSKAAV